MPHWTEKLEREKKSAAWYLGISAVSVGFSFGLWQRSVWAGAAVALFVGTVYFVLWVKS